MEAWTIVCPELSAEAEETCSACLKVSNFSKRIRELSVQLYMHGSMGPCVAWRTGAIVRWMTR